MGLTLAHQMPGFLADALADLLPADIEVIALAPTHAYEVPREADILLATVPRGGNVVVPKAAPENWPGRLKWLHTVSVGVDEFPRWIFDVPLVTCSRGSNSTPIAEYVLAALLAVEKQLLDIWVSRPGDWRIRQLGTLEGKTLGLLGFGSIAQAIAKRALPFGMQVIAHRRSPGPEQIDGVTIAPLETVLREADHLVNTLPLTDETRGTIGQTYFDLLKPGAHFVNISRGGIVDQTALLAALDAGRLGFATLDVTDPEPLPEGHPLYHHPRVRVSPHLSWSGGERTKSLTIFADNLRRFLNGEELLNHVDGDRGY